MIDKRDVATISKLSVDDRLRLVADIWDSIARDGDRVPVPDWHRRELRRRLKMEESDPSAGAPWAEVKARIRRPRRKKAS